MRGIRQGGKSSRLWVALSVVVGGGGGGKEEVAHLDFSYGEITGKRITGKGGLGVANATHFSILEAGVRCKSTG